VNSAFISIGSNIGERLLHLKDAVRALHTHNEVSVLSVSSVYETAPIGYTDQEDFLNIVIEIRTSLDAYNLLSVCQEIEHELGRVRTVRWGPRIVDLDILLYNNDNINAENLIVPHPRMHERAFVLIPLLEIAPETVHPVTGRFYSNEAAVRDQSVLLKQRVNGVEEFIQ
jgi:2-amino-4-hydroxy-6-hydroxymethyldihydropteridine diphosphokinase